MAAEVKLSINRDLPRDVECARLRDHLGEVVATTMQTIAEQTQAALNGVQANQELLNSAVWYPIDYITACRTAKQAERLKFMQNKEHLLHGYLSNKHFTPIRDGNKNRVSWKWILKEGVRPSDALKAAREGLSILDCGTICTITHYSALLDVLGEERFDRLFGRAHGMPLFIDYHDDRRQPICHFIRFTEPAMAGDKSSKEGARTLQKGQVVSFNNAPHYKTKHAFGMGQNYNVCCLDATPGSQTFVGHGLPPEGVSEIALGEFLLERYNAPPSPVGFLRYPETRKSEATAVMSMSDPSRTTTIKEVRGLDTHSYQDFNLNLIYDLLALPFEEVNFTFVKNHPEAQATTKLLEGSRRMRETRAQLEERVQQISTFSDMQDLFSAFLPSQTAKE